jgi:hypothetical protein
MGRDWVARMKRTGLLALLAFLAFAVTAMAASTQTYRGATDQGRKAYVKARDGGVTSANVPWIFKAGNCTPHNGYSLGDGKPYVYVGTPSTPITNNGKWFRAHRHEVFKVNGGGKATIDGKLHGHFTSGKRAVGTSVMKATSNDSHGKHTCKRTIHFSVKLSG